MILMSPRERGTSSKGEMESRSAGFLTFFLTEQLGGSDFLTFFKSEVVFLSYIFSVKKENTLTYFCIDFNFQPVSDSLTFSF